MLYMKIVIIIKVIVKNDKSYKQFITYISHLIVKKNIYSLQNYITTLVLNTQTITK